MFDEKDYYPHTRNHDKTDTDPLEHIHRFCRTRKNLPNSPEYSNCYLHLEYKHSILLYIVVKKRFVQRVTQISLLEHNSAEEVFADFPIQLCFLKKES